MAAAGAGDPPALPHPKFSDDFSVQPTVDFSSLEARLKQRLEEQQTMFEKQEDLRKRLEDIKTACAEEETATQTLEDNLKETAATLEQTVTEACAPVEQLKAKKATAAAELDGFAAAETALREAAKQSQAQESRRGPRTAGDIPDEVAAAGRQVQEWSDRSATWTNGDGADPGGEVAVQNAVAEDLAARADTLTTTVADEIAAVEGLRERLLEKQRELKEAVPTMTSDRARALQEEVFAEQQRSMERTQRLLGYVLKVSARLSSGTYGATPVKSTDAAVRWRRDLSSACVAVQRADEVRYMRLTVLHWRMQVAGQRRLKRAQKALLAAVQPPDEVKKYNVAQSLADLARRLDELFATRLASADFTKEGDSVRSRHDALLADLSKQVQECLKELSQRAAANALEKDLTDLRKGQQTQSEDLERLQSRAQAVVDYLPLCATADNVQNLVGQVVAIWNDVKRTDETKAGRPQLDELRESILAVWANCAAEAAQDPGRIITASGVAWLEAKIATCRTEVDANQAHFQQLEGMLAQLAQFVEEMVQELDKLPNA